MHRVSHRQSGLLAWLLLLLTLPLRAQELIPYRVGSRWGYANARRHLVIRPRYDYAERFDQGLAKVWRGDKCGFINQRGREVVPVRFDRAGYTLRFEALQQRERPTVPLGWAGGQGLVVVMYYDDTTTTTPADPEQPRRRPERPTGWEAWSAWPGVETEGGSGFRVGLYDTTGREVLPPRYAYVRRWIDGLLRAGQVAERYNGSVTEPHGPDRWSAQQMEYDKHPLYKEQLFTPQGRLLLQGRVYPHIEEIRHGRVWVRDYGYPFSPNRISVQDTARRPSVDSTALAWYGEIDDDPRPWHSASEVRPGWNDEYDADNPPPPDARFLLLDSAYRPTSPQRFTSLQAVNGRRVLAGILGPGEEERFGMLDPRTGRWVLAPRYEQLWFDKPEGRYLARQQQHWGIIDSLGRWLLAPRYQQLEPLAAGRYLARSGGCWGVIDGQGRWQHPPSYDTLGQGMWQGRRLVEQNGRVGVIDSMGRELVPPRYGMLEPDWPYYRARRLAGLRFAEEYGGMIEHWQSGVLDSTGREVLPLEYELVTPAYSADDQPAPRLWLARRGHTWELYAPTGRLLRFDAAYSLGGFARGRARLLRDKTNAPTDSVVVLDTLAGRPTARWLRQPLPVPSSKWTGIHAGMHWTDANGQPLVEKWRVNPAHPHDAPGTSWDVSEDRLYGLYRADSSEVLPMRFHRLEPRQRPAAGDYVIDSLIKVRQGRLYGMYTTDGRLLLPVQYEELRMIAGAPDLFWVLRPDGFAAIDSRQRVWHHTHSRRYPSLPAEYVAGYGLALGWPKDGSQVPLGYHDVHGRPFYRERKARKPWSDRR